MQCCENISNFILNLASDDAILANSGGKAENLAKLKKFGYKVPNGFIVTTELYDRFIDGNQLRNKIEVILHKIDYQYLENVDAHAKKIRNQILKKPLPSEIRKDIIQAYETMGDNPPIAVRSSATMEDLPGMSFAGQQDTILNVVGQTDLIEAVKACWSSLWTKRAILYRHKNKVDTKKFSIAVIVQEMVASDYSGVNFTLNPLNGYRKEIIIEVVQGLGELLVSGQIQPQQYTINKQNLEVKTTKIHSGGDRKFLTDVQIKELSEISLQIEGDFGGPQDIEWAIKQNTIYILQTRPITNLFPIPKGFESLPTHVFGSFGAVQGILDPITPLGREILSVLLLGVGNLFGAKWKLRTQKLLYTAAERLWFDMTGIISSPMRDKIIGRISNFADPSMGAIINEISHEFEIKPYSRSKTVKFMQNLARLLPKISLGALNTIKNPLKTKKTYRSFLNNLVESNYLEQNVNPTQAPLKELQLILKDILKISQIFPEIIPKIAAPISTYSILLVIMKKMYRRFLSADKAEEVNQILTEGFKDTITANMGMELLHLTEKISMNEEMAKIIDNDEIDELGRMIIERRFPEPFQTEINNFLTKYGMRGIGEFDIGKPRWSETPSYVMKMIKSNIAVIRDDDHLKKINTKERLSTLRLKKLESELYEASGNVILVKISRKLRYIIQNIMGVREDHKFMMINVFGRIRKRLLEIGEILVEKKMLDATDDLFFLYLDEISLLSKYVEYSHTSKRFDINMFKKRIKDRRELYNQENNRISIPKIILSDGRMYHGDGASKFQPGMKSIRGQPVSSGIVKGKVRVVFDPTETTIQKGEILVCRGTDPAWTPLFLIAGGVIMEVGGMMTHGAVVAREYNLPAIVGIVNATKHLKNGQEIEMNGFNGIIRLF